MAASHFRSKVVYWCTYLIVKSRIVLFDQILYFACRLIEIRVQILQVRRLLLRRVLHRSSFVLFCQILDASQVAACVGFELQNS